MKVEIRYGGGRAAGKGHQMTRDDAIKRAAGTLNAGVDAGMFVDALVALGMLNLDEPLHAAALPITGLVVDTTEAGWPLGIHGAVGLRSAAPRRLTVRGADQVLKALAAAGYEVERAKMAEENIAAPPMESLVDGAIIGALTNAMLQVDVGNPDAEYTLVGDCRVRGHLTKVSARMIYRHLIDMGFRIERG